MPRVSAQCTILLRLCGRGQRAPVRTIVDVVEHAGIKIVGCLCCLGLCFGIRIEACTADEPIAQPGTASITKTICVVGRGAVGDSLGGSGVGIAQGVRHLLKFVCVKSHLVGQDEVMSRSAGALKRHVRLQEEVFTVRVSDDFVDHEARPNVVIHSGVFGHFPVAHDHFPVSAKFRLEFLIFLNLQVGVDVGICLIFFQIGKEAVVLGFDVGEEAGVVPLADDDKCEFELWRIDFG